MDDDSDHIPVTFEHCDHVAGPFYHGTKADLASGDLLIPGHGSNFEDARVSNNIYLTATLDAAIWGAELARGDGAGRVYVVEPTGPFEDDPNLTNKRYPGNPTKSYRTRQPLRVTGEVSEWQGHPPEVLQAMKDHLAEMARQGLATIDD
jgi:rifampin ADP-ribosylating transferase